MSNGYPVSEKVCGKCPMCCEATKDFAGNNLDPEDYTRFCLAMMEGECGDAEGTTQEADL